jgi:nucleoside-diphosphate-sugar epimerase
MPKLLVTGASGFLGSALARFWVERGHEVHLLVRPGSELARVAPVREYVALHVAAVPHEAMRVLQAIEPDIVVHTACAYGRTGETPCQILEANVGLGVALLQAICEGKCRVTFFSTGSAIEPDVSLYALTKRQFADWGAQLAARSPERLRFVDLRLQHMYGPGDDRSKFTTHVLHTLHADAPELQLTAGEQQRDFIHIDDVVSAYDVLLAHADELPAHDSIEVGSGEAPRVREFVELVQWLTGAATRLDFGAIPYRPNEAMRCVADTTRLRGLGWRPAFDLVSGLQDTLRKEFQS